MEMKQKRKCLKKKKKTWPDLSHPLIRCLFEINKRVLCRVASPFIMFIDQLYF